MAKLFVDTDKYADGEGPPVVEAYNSALKALVRRRLDECKGDWHSFVFDRAYSLVTAQDIAEIERQLLATGYRFTSSAMISQRERPDAYKPMAGLDPTEKFSFEHPEARSAPVDVDGRALCGQGDNVGKSAHNTIGTARYFRSSEQVMDCLQNGVPKDTIAIIDDSGGTLTAPILEQFKGVICAGGTVRSHLGILTREYGIPCVMNAKIRGVYQGDTVEIETTGQAKTAEAYAKGEDMAVRIWKRSA